MKRVGSIRSVETIGTKDPAYIVDAQLKVDRTTLPFKVTLNSDHTLWSFAPKGLDFSYLPQGLGYDEVKDPEIRSRCIAAVSDFCRRWDRAVYESAAIQRMRGNFVVTYFSIPRSIQEEFMLLDQYISFVVTPKGTVFAVLFGT